MLIPGRTQRQCRYRYIQLEKGSDHPSDHADHDSDHADHDSDHADHDSDHDHEKEQESLDNYYD